MSTISSKHVKRQGIFDPVLVLISLSLIIALLALGPVAADVRASISQALTSWSSPSRGADLASGSEATFAADQAYWDANCRHGWSSGSTCDDIVRRTQSCRISLASAYCSAYDSHLRSFRN